MTHFRQDLEQTIIGACLLENGYDRVAGILSNKNFTSSNSFDHQAIFKAIEGMYPTTPIDLLTVTYKLNKPDYTSYLANCANKVCSAANLRYHAFMLLQLCMRDVLIKRLDKASRAEFTTATKAAIQEIIDDCLDSSYDILDIYDIAPRHLANIGAEESLVSEINSLKEGLREKANKIKQQAHIDCLFANIERIPGMSLSTKSKLCLAQLVDQIKGILVTGRN